MPIFEYQCQECMTVSEFLTGMGNDEPIVCKSCGSLKMERVFSRPVILDSAMRQAPGQTCCGREERCESPPCSAERICRRD